MRKEIISDISAPEDGFVFESGGNLRIYGTATVPQEDINFFTLKCKRITEDDSFPYVDLIPNNPDNGSIDALLHEWDLSGGAPQGPGLYELYLYVEDQAGNFAEDRTRLTILPVSGLPIISDVQPDLTDQYVVSYHLAVPDAFRKCTITMDIFDSDTKIKTIKEFDQLEGDNSISWVSGMKLGYELAEYKEYSFKLHALDDLGNNEAYPGAGVIYPPVILTAVADHDMISPNNDGIQDYAVINVTVNDFRNLNYAVYSGDDYNTISAEERDARLVYEKSKDDLGALSSPVNIVFNGMDEDGFNLAQGPYSVVFRNSLGTEAVVLIEIDLNNANMTPAGSVPDEITEANPEGEIIHGINHNDNSLIENYSKLYFNRFSGSHNNFAFEKIGSFNRSVYNAVDSANITALTGERFGAYNNDDSRAYLNDNLFGGMSIRKQKIGEIISSPVLADYDQVFINKSYTKLIGSTIIPDGRRVLEAYQININGDDETIGAHSPVVLTGIIDPNMDFLCFDPSGNKILINVRDNTGKRLILYDIDTQALDLDINNAYSGKEALSANGNYLVYYQGDNVMIMDFNEPDSDTIGTINDLGLFEGFGIGDNKLVFSDLNNNINIYNFTIGGGDFNKVLLSTDASGKLQEGENYFGVFSREHRYIGFSKIINNQKDMFVYDLQADSITRIIANNLNEDLLGFSFDNKRIAYMEVDEYQKEHLKIMDIQFDSQKYITAEITSFDFEPSTTPNLVLDLIGTAESDDFNRYEILFQKAGKDTFTKYGSDFSTAVPAGPLCSIDTTSLDGDGDYRISLRVYDNAGNWEEDIINVSINNYYDNVPPVISGSAPVQDETTSALTIDFTVYETGSGVDWDSVVLYINGFKYESGDTALSYTSDANGGTLIFDASELTPNPLTLYPDGAVSAVSVSLKQVKDNAGNNIVSPYEFTYTYDQDLAGVNAFEPDILRDGNENIYAAWTGVAVGNQKQVNFEKRSNRGDTVEDSKTLGAINQDSYQPSIAINDSSVVIAFRYEDPASSGVNIGYRAIGTTDEFTIKTITGAEYGYDPVIKTDGTTFYIAYLDKQGNGSKLNLCSTVDFNTFVDYGLVCSDDLFEFDFCVNGDLLAFTYQKNDSVYLKHWDGSGFSEVVVIEEDTDMFSSPSIASAQGIEYLVWDSKKDGDPEIYLAVYEAGEDIIQKKITENDHTSRNPDIQINEDNISIVWEDNRDGNFEIYSKSSFNLAGTFNSDINLSDNTGLSINASSALLDDNDIFIAWEDDTAGAREVKAQRFEALDLPLSTTAWPGMDSQSAPVPPDPSDPHGSYIGDGLTIIGDSYYSVNHVYGVETFPEEDPLNMTFYYDEAQLGGVNEQDLRIYIFDEAAGDWVIASDVYSTEYDYENNAITVYLVHLSDFAIFFDPNGPGEVAFTTADSVVNYSSIDIEGTADPDTMVYLYRDGVVLAEQPSGPSGLFSFSNVNLDIGENVFQAVSKDSQNKFSVFSEKLTIAYDTRIPGVIVKKDGNPVPEKNIFFNSNNSIDLEGYDGLQDGYASGVKEIYYSLEEYGDAPVFQLYTGPVSVTGLNKRHDLQYYAVDFAGNSSTPESKTVVLENIPPYADISVTGGVEKDGNYYISYKSTVNVYAFDIGTPVSGIASKEYRINGQGIDWERYTLPLHLTNEGAVTVLARAFDLAGNVSKVAQKDFLMDNTPPSLSVENIYIYDGKYIISPQKTIEISAEDSGVGLDSVFWLHNNKKYNYNSPFKLADIDDFAGLQNEDYLLFHLYANDNVFNSTSMLVPIEIDSLAPAISIFNLSEGDVLRKNVMLRGKIYDKYLKEYTVSISPDTGPADYTLLVAGSENVNGENFYLLDISQYESGSYILKIEAVDQCSNISVEEIHFKITDDDVPPVTTVSFTVPYYCESGRCFVKQNSMIRLSAEDPGTDSSGVQYTEYRIDGRGWTEYAGQFALNYPASGTHTLEFRSVDNVNNVEDIKSQTIGFDIDPPASTVNVTGIITPENHVSVNNEYIISSIDMSGVKEIQYNIDDAGYQVYTNAVITFNSGGDHNIKYKAVDRLDNQETEKLFEIFVDVSAPVIDITGVTEGVYYNYNVQADIAVTDDSPYTSTNRLNGQDYISSTPITNENDYLLLVFAKDIFHNISSRTVNFVIDKTPPLITVTGVTDEGVYNYDVIPVVTIEELYSKTNIITLNGEPLVSGAAIHDDGEYVLNVYAEDLAGNISTVGVSFIIDNTPPDVPEGLIGYVEDVSNVRLFWNEVTNKDLSGYNIYDNGIKINTSLITNENYYITDVSTGTHIYQVSSVDWLGNESELSAPFIRIIDNSIAITWPDPGIYYRKMVNIIISKDFEITGPDASKSKIIIEYGAEEIPDSWSLIKEYDPLPKNRGNIVCPWQLREKINEEWEDLNGVFRIRVKLINESGVRESSVVVWIDNEAPETSISNTVANQNNELYLSTGELIFIQNDPVVNGIASGVKNTKYTISQDNSMPGGNWITWDMQPIQLANGAYNIRYFSEDNTQMCSNINQTHIGNLEGVNYNILIVSNEQVLNITTGSEEYTVTDNDPPQISISGAVDGQYYNHNITVDVSVSDKNLKDYSIVLKQGDEITSSQTGHVNVNHILPEVSEEGDYLVTVQAEDKAGNAANIGMDFGIDKTYPIVEILGVEDGATNYNEARPEVDIIEEHPKEIWTNLGYTEKINKGYGKIDFNSGDLLTNKGKYKLDAGVEDKAGNITAKTAEFALRKLTPDELLLFRAEYNANGDADYANGDKKDLGEAKITKGGMGKEGEALLVKNKGKHHPARYKSLDNIDERHGSIMMWLKPLWDTAVNKEGDQGRHIFTLYETGRTNYSIKFVVFKDIGTTARIRYVSEGANYVHTISVDTNTDESQRWYNDVDEAGQKKWTHLTLTWDSTIGMIKIYVNGVLQGMKAVEKWNPFYTGIHGRIEAGDACKGGSKEFNGYIDRIKIYSRPLTDTQVKGIYEGEN